MAEVRPFEGIRYRLASPEDAGAVIAPPYDVVSPSDERALHERHPNNVIRLELPREEPGDGTDSNRYTRAAVRFREWLRTGVLARDGPCLYVYGQRYQVSPAAQAAGPNTGTPEQPNAGTQERLGVLGALRVEPYESGVVLPHEQTFPKHKEDRYRLLTAAGAQFSPIFGLYDAPKAFGVREALDRWADRQPDAVAVDGEGVEHRLWAVPDPEFARWVGEVFAGRQVYIADGHHRYETALRYRNERRAAAAAGWAGEQLVLPESGAPVQLELAAADPGGPSEYVMTFLVEMNDPGLVLLPTHRLVRAPLPPAAELRDRLSQHFRIDDVPLDDVDRLDHHQIGVVLRTGESWRMTLASAGVMDRLDREHSPAWRELDVALLHRLVLCEILGVDRPEDIAYTRDAAEARAVAASGEFSAAFLLPPPSVDELKRVAGAGDRMPEKSTYFWPKAVTGLVIYGE